MSNILFGNFIDYLPMSNVCNTFPFLETRLDLQNFYLFSIPNSFLLFLPRSTNKKYHRHTKIWKYFSFITILKALLMIYFPNKRFEEYLDSLLKLNNLTKSNMN